MKTFTGILSYFLWTAIFAALWTYVNFGQLSVPQTLSNLANINVISSKILLSFGLWVMLPSIILSFAPGKLQLIFIPIGLAFFFFEFNIIKYFLNQNIYNTLYEDEFVTINKHEISHPENAHNLVVIYVESLEKQYGDSKYNREILTPFIQTQKDKEISFEGYYQLPATKYTLAGILASQCALKNNSDFKNTISTPDFYPQLACIPDILAQNGYTNYFFKSANLEFANTIFYAKQHSFQVMKGYPQWKAENPDNTNIQGNSWGVRDSFLYEQIKNTILQAEAKHKPYAIFAITVDTHGEADFLDPLCQPAAVNSQNIVKCADTLLKNFIEWCQTQPFYKQLTIVILGDHTAHGINNPIYIKQPQNRQIENIIFNSVKKDKIAHQWTTFDVAPTIMEAIGYTMPAMGLGRSLFANETTLYEKYGKKLNILLEQQSHFLDHATSDKTLNKYVNKRFLEIKKNHLYQGENELMPLEEFSYQADFSLGYLWLRNLNLEIDSSQEATLEIDAIAIHNNKDRVFNVYANDEKIGQMIFEKDKNENKTFYITIPRHIMQHKKITLDFINNDIQHWSMHLLGIGIRKLTIR